MQKSQDQPKDLAIPLEHLASHWAELLKDDVVESNKFDMDNLVHVRDIVNEVFANVHHEKHADLFSEAEVEKGVSYLKSSKASSDILVADLLKAGGCIAVTTLKDLFNVVITTKAIPQDWKLNVTVALYKGKGDAKDANNYCGVSLISSVCKLFVHLLLVRIQPTIEKCLHNEQAGFRPGRGTEEQVFLVDNILERYKRKGQALYVCFVDLAKAFDTVYRPALWYKRLEA